ncbi:hypothetical protein ACIBSV_46280 [Embleya sp. NPDC050154]
MYGACLRILEYVGLNAHELHRPAHREVFATLATLRANGHSTDIEDIA